MDKPNIYKSELSCTPSTTELLRGNVLKLLCLDLKVIYLACNLKLYCINDTRNLATEAIHSPPISLNKLAGTKDKWV